MNSVDDLLEVLTLKNEKDYYLGVSETVGSKNVFGGQVLAQSLNAAYQSINDRKLQLINRLLPVLTQLMLANSNKR